MEKNYEKYDVRRIFASVYAKNDDAYVADITLNILEKKGIKKVMVEISYGADDGWSLVKRHFATNLPLPEDLEALKGRKVVDVLLQSGWNDEANEWGKVKVKKFILDDGEEVTFNGVKDEPGLEGSDDEE